MAAVDEELLERVQSLSDLSLAALLCLVNRQHCLISTRLEALDDLVLELQLISSRIFDLRSAVVRCTPQTTPEDFATALLLPDSPSVIDTSTDGRKRTASPSPRKDSLFSPQASSSGGTIGPESRATLSIANVVLARDLDRAPKIVQIQALELLRSRRIFTRTAVQTAPKQFLFVAIVGAPTGGAARVTQHLNDHLFLSHWHDPEEQGYEFLDAEQYDTGDVDARENRMEKGLSSQDGSERGTANSARGDNESIASSESIVKTPRIPSAASKFRQPTITMHDIAHLSRLTSETHVDIDVFRYQMNIVSYLRMHRAVAGGVTPTATKHFETLVKALAPLHGLCFVTPALVGMAARKIYTHRIAIVAPERERSLQWGSELAAIRTLLEGVGPEDVIEDVLDSVTAPI
jgi:hypothetical protein